MPNPLRIRRQAGLSRHRLRRRTLLATPPDGPCYLWRNFATTGQRANEYELYVPFAAGRYAVYSFKDHIASSGGILYFGRFKEGVPVLNLPAGDASVTQVGTWANSANAAAYNGVSRQSSTAGDTITATMTGHTLLLRQFFTSNGGFGTVAIDGDFTAAARLPAVTQAEVDLGWFAAGDIGKRYIESYSASAYEDEHEVLAEGLTDAPHTVQVRVQGTKRAASSGTRVYIPGFAAATSGQSLTTANASMGYVRDISNIRTGTTFSKMTMVPEFTPEGFVNYQFMGGNHGNESLVSQQFLVDGAVATPAAGEYLSGSVIRSELVSHLTHPSTGASVIAVKTGDFEATASPPRMRYQYQLAWQNAGAARNSYYGMMHVGRRPRAVSTLEQTIFDRFLVGDTYVTDVTANNGTSLGLTAADLQAGFSTQHDTVAVLYLPSLELNVDHFSRSGTGAFIEDRTDNCEKMYFSRSTAGGLEAITPSTVHTGEIQWRLLRVPSAAAALGF